MAKIQRLFPDWELPSPDKVDDVYYLRTIFNITERMNREELPMQAILPLQEELQTVEMLEELRTLISLMLITDPDERPFAAAVLALNEYRALEKRVSA